MVVDWEDRLCIMDTLIYCRFYRDLVEWPYLTRVVNAALGSEFSEADLHGIANRIVTESHDFNARRGFGPDKERLPKWITESGLITGGREARITADELEMMRGDYYDCRGWQRTSVVDQEAR